MKETLDLMQVMNEHQGKANGIGMKELAEKLNRLPRDVRLMITACRDKGIPICGHPATGYFLATTKEELEETIKFLNNRALHSLKLASNLSKQPLAQLIGQLQLNIEKG